MCHKGTLPAAWCISNVLNQLHYDCSSQQGPANIKLMCNLFLEGLQANSCLLKTSCYAITNFPLNSVF